MAVMAMCVLLSCTEKKEEATLSGLMKSNFVSEVQGKPTALYVLKNQNGAEDRKSTRLNSSHTDSSRMPSSA